MADQQGQSTQNWFERHPKQTIVWLVLILILAATYGAEKLLAYINHTHNLVLFTERRYINLREILPGVDTVDVPPDRAVRESDGLVQKPYRVRTDSRGFMLPYNRYEKPDLTLVFLGGSTVACIYVEEENRFPYLVGNLLAQKTGKKITSINSGVGGNNSSAFPGYFIEQDYPAPARRRRHDAQYQRPGGPDLRPDLLEQKPHPGGHRQFLVL